MGSPPGAARSRPIKHRARDALALADLRLSGLQHASMSRGVEVRGSSGTKCVPRALGTSRELRKSECDEGLPGADKRIRAMNHVCANPPRHPEERGGEVAEPRRVSESEVLRWPLRGLLRTTEKPFVP